MEKNKDDLIAVQPVLREFSPAFGYKQYGVPYHPGALKFSRSTISRPRPLDDRRVALQSMTLSKQGDVS